MLLLFVVHPLLETHAGLGDEVFDFWMILRYLLRNQLCRDLRRVNGVRRLPLARLEGAHQTFVHLFLLVLALFPFLHL